jgi:DNA-binding LytR/AlgR family response regulator
MAGRDLLQQEPVDLLFLDINLPDLSGINFYQTLIQKPAVIFTTAYPEFAVEGFELEAVDYLLKPFSFERFRRAIGRVKSGAEDVPEHITLKVDKKTYRLAHADIQYIESIGDYVKVHLHDQVLIASETMKKLEETLPGDQFMRVHKSYIVATDAIQYLEGNRLSLADQKIPVGHSYRARVSAFFQK